MENDLLLLGKVALAALLGGLIGLEREAADKPAGLRTNMLVAAASALFVILGYAIVLEFPDPNLLRADPNKIIEAIMVGISFLGAGTIFRGNRDVKGLTTAASLLIAGAIGVSVALEHFILAVGVAVLTLVINYLIGKFETRAKEKSNMR